MRLAWWPHGRDISRALEAGDVGLEEVGERTRSLALRG
jgi:hypothetical protein